MKSAIARILGVSLTATLCGSAAAQDVGDFYGQLDGGVSFLADNEALGLTLEYDTGFVFGGRLGYKPHDLVRVELGANYSENDISSLANITIIGTTVSTADLSAGAYLDINTGTIVTPYVGGGAGVVYKELDSAGVSEDDTDITVHGEFGMSFNVTPNVILVPHYRLAWYADFFEQEQFDHWFRLGIRLSQ